MATNVKLSDLAINGGPKVRTDEFPSRYLLGIEEKAAVDQLFDEAIKTGEAFGYNGPQEQAYCEEFAEFMGGGFADAVNSGTNAVYVALRALDLEPFTEVIVSPITDPGGVMPIVMMNCIPMLADAAPGKYNTGPGQVEELISPRTSAILIAHIAGEPADIEGVIAVAKKHNIPVVEDCAQAHYTKLNGKLLGTFGDIAAFSTMFGKHHCTGGQGGVVFTKSEKLYQQARWASDRGKPFGLGPDATNCVASLNLNLNDLSATIGRVQLKKLPSIIERRRKVAAQITEGFKDLKAVVIPEQISGAEPSYWFWRLALDTEKLTCTKDDFCAALIAEGMPILPSYRHLANEMDWWKNRRVFGTSGLPWSSPAYKGDPNRKFDLKNAIAATDVQFNIFINESYGDKEVADIVAAFKKVEAAYLK